VQEEIWRDIPGYEGLYQASNLGHVRNKKTGRILSQKLDRRPGKEYFMVGLMKDKKRKFIYVSRCVWSAFNGHIPEGMEINHINEIKSDNRLENLNLMTRKENLNWGTRNQRSAEAQSKKVLQYDLNGNFIKEWPSVKSVAMETGYSKGFIAGCCRQLPHYKTGYGFIWRYAG